jgi:hypothetical protein
VSRRKEGEKMERDRKNWGEKEKWGKRGLSELVFGQNGVGRYVTVRWKKK